MLLRILSLLAAIVTAAMPATAFDDPRVPGLAPAPLATAVPPPRPADGARCTADGRGCVALATYAADVCRLIESAARENALDANFFARLLWKESLFDAAAVSPAGAQGIAQFMPGTAKLRGLSDAFNPAEALYASAAYLADLSRAYGNIGLAAAAYNAGEAGLERFLAAKSGLPGETRAYVAAITGYPVEAWRDSPPETLDLSLATGEGGGASAFQAACVAQAEKRSVREFRSGPKLKPWGVVVASNRENDGAERQVSRLRNRFATVLGGEDVAYSRGRSPGQRTRMVFAQVGRDSRAEADAFCGRLRAAGGDCMVLRN
jgi:Transglycosylase SLT domain/SPOR domain